MKKLQISLFLAFFIFTLSQVVSAQVYTSKKDEFSIWFPGAPKYALQTTDEGNKTRSYSFGTNKAYFSVIIAEMPTGDISEETKAFMFDQIRDAATNMTGSKVIGERDISVSGFTGRELKITKKSPFGTMLMTDRIYLIGNQLYQTISNTLIKSPQTVTVNKFHNSFKYLGEPAEPAEPESSEE